MLTYPNSFILRLYNSRLIVLIAFIYSLLIHFFISYNSILLAFSAPFFLLGIYLFNKPYVCFWALTFLAFLCGPLISYIPELYYLRWGISLISLLLFIRTILDIILQRHKTKILKNTTLNIYIFFIIYSLIISIVNQIPIEQIIISFKNYHQFFPVALFLLVYPLENDFFIKLKKNLLLIGIAQIPTSIYQYFFIVPQIKVITGLQSTEVLDAVSGTFGTSLKGGGTGVLALLMCTFLCALLVCFNKKEISFRKFIIFLPLLMIPLLISETKISFIYLLIGTSVVFFGSDKFGLKSILIIVFIVIMIFLSVYSILILSEQSGYAKEKLLEDTLAYNFGEKGYGKYVLNRFTCLAFWFDENKLNIIDLLIGNGLDSTAEGEVGLSAPGSIALRYPMYGTSLTTASSMLWENGIIGFLLFLSALISNFLACIKIYKIPYIDINERFFIIVCAIASLLIITNLFYNSAIRGSQPANMFIMIIIGVTMSISSKNNHKPRW